MMRREGISVTRHDIYTLTTEGQFPNKWGYVQRAVIRELRTGPKSTEQLIASVYGTGGPLYAKRVIFVIIHHLRRSAFNITRQRLYSITGALSGNGR